MSLIFFLVLAGCEPCGSSGEAASPGPALRASVESIDFGAVKPHESPSRTVEITNHGKAPLALQVKSTCPCTKASLHASTIAPGATMPLEVRLSLADYHSDKVRGTVFVQYGEGESSGVLAIATRAEIQPEYLIEPSSIDFGGVKRGKIHTATFFVRQNGPQDFILKEIDAPGELKTSYALVKPPAAKEGDPSPTPQPKTYRVEVQYKPVSNAKTFASKLALVTNISRKPRAEVRVRAKIIGVECTITPKVIVFGPVRPGATLPAIEVTGPNTIEIAEARCTAKHVQCKVETIEAHKRHRVTLHLAEDTPAGDLFGKVVLTLKEGELSTIRRVSIYGTVEK